MCDINKLFLIKKGKDEALKTPKKTYDIKVTINGDYPRQLRIGMSYEAWKKMSRPERIMCGFDRANPNRLYFFPDENGYKVGQNSGAKKNNTYRYVNISASKFKEFAELFIGEANLEMDPDNHFYIVTKTDKERRHNGCRKESFFGISSETKRGAVLSARNQ